MKELIEFLKDLDKKLLEIEESNKNTEASRTKRVLLIAISSECYKKDDEKSYPNIQSIVSILHKNANISDIKMNYFKGERKWLVLPADRLDYEIFYHVEFFEIKDFHVNNSLISCKDVVRFLTERISTVYEQYNGFVVLYPDNYLEYVTSALSFALENLSKPIVFVDYRSNLLTELTSRVIQLREAISIAACFEIPEVTFLKFHKLMRGNRLIKNKEGEYYTPNYPPLGTLVHNEFIPDWKYINTLPYSRMQLTPFYEFDKDVVSITLHPLLRYKSLQSLAREKDIKAVILETYGLGEAPIANPDFTDLCRLLIENNKVALAITQCLKGFVDTVYDNNIFQYGVETGLDMTLPAAAAKLSYLLGKHKSIDKVKELLRINLAGELTEELRAEAQPKSDVKNRLVHSLKIDGKIKDQLFHGMVLPELFFSSLNSGNSQFLETLNHEGYISKEMFQLKTKEGQNILHLFALRGGKALFDFICRYVKEDDIKRFANETDLNHNIPIYYAIKGKNKDTIGVLSDYTEVPLLTNQNKDFIKIKIFQALDLKDLEILKYFYFGGLTDFNELTTETGLNPAHYAVFIGFGEFINFLRSDVAEFDFEAKDKNGKTPMDYARDLGREDLIDPLS